MNFINKFKKNFELLNAYQNKFDYNMITFYLKYQKNSS